MTIDLTPIFQAIITLIASLITLKLIPYIKARTSEKQHLMLNAVVNTLVFAAEQLYGAGHGKDKLEFVQKELIKRGFTADIEAIEGAVWELINGKKKASY